MARKGGSTESFLDHLKLEPSTEGTGHLFQRQAACIASVSRAGCNQKDT